MADAYHTPIDTPELIRLHQAEGQVAAIPEEANVLHVDQRHETNSDVDGPHLSLPKKAAKSMMGFCLETSEGLRPYHPGITVAETAGYKLRRITEAARQDYSESNNKKRAGVLGGFAVATQAADRLRLGVVLVPKVATRVLEDTAAVKPTAAAAAAVFMGWNFAVGEVANYALDEYPRTVEQFKEEFPTFVALFEQSLPGMRKNNTETGQADHPGLIKRVAKRASVHTKRALSGISLGSTAYVATAAAQGRTRGERTRINAQVTAATGALVGGLGATVAWSVLELPERGHAWAAEKISSTVSNMKIWWGVAAAMIGTDYYLNKKQVAAIEADDEPLDTSDESGVYDKLSKI